MKTCKLCQKKKEIKKGWTCQSCRKEKGRSSTWYRKKEVAKAKKTALVRDNYTCQRCGRTKESGIAIHASHVYPEGRYVGMSADPMNIKALCYQCHFLWWHKHPIEAGAWFKETFPERAEYLLEQSRKTIQVDWKKRYGV